MDQPFAPNHFVNCDDGFLFTAPIRSFMSNPFGLHDMIGNAQEWCADAWHGDYTGAPQDGTT
jgi:formylglycine-generating enzyme required for sulfatase activity